MRLALLVAVLISSASVAAPLLSAQGRPLLSVELPETSKLTTDGPAIRSRGILSRRETRELLFQSFPSRLHYRVELWSRSGFFNELRESVEWDVVVTYDPLAKTFRVHRSLDGRSFTVVGSGLQFDQMLLVVENAFQAPIRPPRRADRYYYEVVLVVETLSISDLDEVERWLRGEVQPAIRLQRNPGTALASGVRRLFVRLIGGERDQFQARSGTFRLG
ncbi:MAG TPA: hypothetical protein VKA84_18515 [Gemmatimonadaceae bacterium]|nr:hypothetical protein [Gemmatimonadaceae bacterium]